MRRVPWFVIVLAAVASACGSPSAPSSNDALTESSSTTHIQFRFSAGDAVEAQRQEAFHEWAVERLGVNPSTRLTYNKYRNPAHVQRMTGQQTNGWADPASATVHTIWPFDGHEAVHVYTGLMGRPSDFFNEGIAVAMAVDPLAGRMVSLWNNTPIDDLASGMQRGGTLPALAGMVETEAFRRVSDQVSYPVAGSFVSYVVVSYGMTAVRTFFAGSTRGDSVDAIRSRFATSFGVTLEQAEAEWRASLR